MKSYKKVFLIISLGVTVLSAQGCGSLSTSSLPPLDPSAYSTEPTNWEEINIIGDMVSEINTGFEESSAKGFEAAFRHVYPGSLNLDKAIPCAQALVDSNVRWELIFNDRGASLLNEWRAPASPEEDWVFEGQIPQGNTYITNLSGVRSGGIDNISAGMGFVHITVLDGQAYLFSPFCGDRW